MEGSVSRLLQDLASEDSDVQDQVSDRLVELGKEDDAVVGRVIPLLRGKKRVLKIYAASILLRIGEKAADAVPDLARLFEDRQEEDGVRSTAANALGFMGARGMKELVQQLKNKDDEFARKWAASMLCRTKSIGDAAVPYLIDALDDPSVDVRSAAASSLEQFGEPAMQPLRKAIRERDARTKMYAAKALLRIAPESLQELVPEVVQGLKSDREEVRARAAWVWGVVEDKARAHASALPEPLKARAVSALTDSLKDEDPEVRYGSARGLAVFGPDASSAVPQLTAALADKDNSVRFYAAMALGDIGPAAKPAVPALAKAINDDDYEAAILAVHALGQIGPDAREAVPALEQALKNGKWKEDEDFAAKIAVTLSIIRKR